MAISKKIMMILVLFVLTACSTNIPIGVENKYKTIIRVHYSAGWREEYTFYTENKIDVCSFNGTNYLIEKDDSEELMSTTAPIEIVKQTKFDKDGNETECETSYYRGAN